MGVLRGCLYCSLWYSSILAGEFASQDLMKHSHRFCVGFRLRWIVLSVISASLHLQQTLQIPYGCFIHLLAVLPHGELFPTKKQTQFFSNSYCRLFWRRSANVKYKSLVIPSLPGKLPSWWWIIAPEPIGISCGPVCIIALLVRSVINIQRNLSWKTSFVIFLVLDGWCSWPVSSTSNGVGVSIRRRWIRSLGIFMSWRTSIRCWCSPKERIWRKVRGRIVIITREGIIYRYIVSYKLLKKGIFRFKPAQPLSR